MLSLIIDNCSAVIFTHDLNGRLLTVNTATEQLLGYTKEELLTFTLKKLMPEQYSIEFGQQYLPQLVKDGKATGTMQVITKSGQTKHLQYNNNIFTETDQAPLAICFAQDITERIEYEESQRTRNNTFQSAFDYSAIGMALIDPQGNIQEVNNAFCAFTGYSKTEILKMNFLDLSHPDDNATDILLLHNMLMKVINHYTIEKRYISKFKKVLWASHTVSKDAYTNEDPQLFILQVTDITKKKELTDELGIKKHELEAMEVALVNNLSKLEELNYIIAHNLRGPANNMRGLIEILMSKKDPHEGSLVRMEETEIIDFLDKSSNSLLGSLNTLMDVVQISMNKGIAYDRCDVRFIINEIINQLNNTVFEKRAIFRLKIDASFISYPKAFLESILYNLISNALKYSSPVRTPEIVVSSYIANNKPTISVKDNGLGLDLNRYGHKLFKLHQVFHSGQDSKGIGLFITKAQIESFGGNIVVSGAENEGLEFVVTL